MPHIKSLIEEYNIVENITLLGECGNVNEWMQAFDIFLFPSTYEGLGIVLIEAQDAGLKCVISDTIPQEADITDLIIRCSLNDAIEKWTQILLMQIPYERKSRASDVIAAGYGIEAVVGKLTNLYLSL